MTSLTSSVGRKALMALTGFFMVTFLVAHLAGNTTFWGGPRWINSYAEHLHELSAILWPMRVFLAAALLIHVLLGILLTLENRASGHGKYAVTRRVQTSFSGRTMIWTGLVLLVFLVFHLLHFTFRVLPGVVVVQDGTGRMDVYTMMVSGLLDRFASLVYVLAMFALFLHVSHGFQSLFQTLGLSNDRTRPWYGFLAGVLSVVFLIGFASIPVLIVTHVLN